MNFSKAGFGFSGPLKVNKKGPKEPLKTKPTRNSSQRGPNQKKKKPLSILKKQETWKHLENENLFSSIPKFLYRKKKPFAFFGLRNLFR